MACPERAQGVLAHLSAGHTERSVLRALQVPDALLQDLHPLRGSLRSALLKPGGADADTPGGLAVLVLDSTIPHSQWGSASPNPVRSSPPQGCLQSAPRGRRLQSGSIPCKLASCASDSCRHGARGGSWTTKRRVGFSERRRLILLLKMDLIRFKTRLGPEQIREDE